RRQRPQILISWTRIAAGEWRDPLIGRDLLIGTASGIAIALVAICPNLFTAWLGYGSILPAIVATDAVNGPGELVARLVAVPVVLGTFFALSYLLLFV